MKLIVCPLSSVETALASKPSHVLSLISPNADIPSYPGIPPANRLILRFNDINGPAENLTAASTADIAAFIAFARTWHGPLPLLAHCWAGISRSTAAAYIIACLHHESGAEQHVARQLREASPQATPNPWMIALADTILGRQGRMTEAIAYIGRGREADHGDLFTMGIQSRVI